MKIMKAFDKKVGKTEYHKYRVNLPKKIVEDSDLLFIPNTNIKRIFISLNSC